MNLKKQMKRVTALFMTAVVAAGCCPAQWIDNAGAAKAQAAEEDLKYGKMTYFVLYDGTVAITDCEEDINGTIIIPETIDGKSVSEISEGAFSNCKNLISVTIPEGVKTIDYSAFAGCSSLSSVQLPNTLEVIDVYAFEDCSSLTELAVPANVRKIGYDCEEGGGYWYPSSVFKGCSSLTAIHVDGQNANYTSEDGILFDKAKDQLIYYPGGKQGVAYEIPSNVTAITYAFRDCVYLETVTVPANVFMILPSAFSGGSVASIQVDAANKRYYSENGILFAKDTYGPGEIYLHTYPSGKKNAAYTIPANLTGISYAAVSGCKYLTSVIVSSGIQSIPESAFLECINLTHVELPESLTSLGNAAFSRCTKLTEIVLPSGIKDISEGLFYECAGLTKVTLPAGIKKIRQSAFEGCKSLKSIAIPNGVTYIEDRAFQSCESLSSIQIPDSVTEIMENSFHQCAQKGIPLTIYCKDGSAAYQYAKANGIATKPYEDFGKPAASQENGNSGNSSNGGDSGNGSGGSQPTETWKKGIKQEVSGAVYTNLGNGTVSYAASAKKAAKSVTVPAYIKLSGKTYPVTQVSANALKNNKQLTKVTIGKNVKQIGANAFSGCKKLKTVTIKSKVLKKVGKKAFKGIDRKAKIKVPKAKLAAYKKLLKGKGQAKSVKVMK